MWQKIQVEESESKERTWPPTEAERGLFGFIVQKFQNSDTVRELVKDDPMLEKIFVLNRVSSEWFNHDNWNGGIDFYTVNIKVPVNIYKQITGDNREQDLENTVMQAFHDSMKDVNSIDVQGVSIIPYKEDNDDNIVNENAVKYWTPGYFRMFISHVSSHKQSAAILKLALADYGISGFVAHEDIEPTIEWQEEIIAALRSMDALCAILTEEFNGSKWCDQEVGFGLGRNVLCIPIKHGIDPYGILGKYQGAKAAKDARDVAKQIFKLLCSNEKTHEKYISVLSNLFLGASNKEASLKWLDVLNSVENLTKPDVNYIRSHISDAYEPLKSSEVLTKINKFFHNYGVAEYAMLSSNVVEDVDDLPF